MSNLKKIDWAINVIGPQGVRAEDDIAFGVDSEGKAAIKVGKTIVNEDTIHDEIGKVQPVNFLKDTKYEDKNTYDFGSIKYIEEKFLDESVSNQIFEYIKNKISHTLNDNGKIYHTQSASLKSDTTYASCYKYSTFDNQYGCVDEYIIINNDLVDKTECDFVKIIVKNNALKLTVGDGVVDETGKLSATVAMPKLILNSFANGGFNNNMTLVLNYDAQTYYTAYGVDSPVFKKKDSDTWQVIETNIDGDAVYYYELYCTPNMEEGKLEIVGYKPITLVDNAN